MHPELLNNSLFLRYYHHWLDNPGSIVYASIAEFFIQYGHIDEAIKICRDGLKYAPNAVSGRMALAKALIKKGNLDEADEELRRVLSIMPLHTKAQKLRVEIEFAAGTGDEVDLSVVAFADSANDNDNADGEEETTAEFKVDKAYRQEIAREEVQEAPTWQTVTMAKIYSAQGHREKAREIYHAILSRDPSNREAIQGLNSLGGGE